MVEGSVVLPIPPYYDGVEHLPITKEYPDNIFTWLGGSYDLNVSEIVTSLCPEALCADDEKANDLQEDIRLLTVDIYYIYLHIITPIDLSGYLPAISGNWKGFGREKGEKNDDESERFKQFVKAINKNNVNGLHVLHSLLPHIPYKYLPSGLEYTPDNSVAEALSNEQWDDNEAIVDLAYHRYILQTGFVDSLLGEFIQRLEMLKVYDQALIIVTSDHGISFQPGHSRRAINHQTYQDILPVPLFVKHPGDKQQGQINDRYVSNLDIIPTIDDILDVNVPWEIDGYSVFSGKNRSDIIVPVYDPYRKLRYDPDLSTQFQSLDRQIDLFGSGEGFGFNIFKGKYREIIV